MAQNSEAKRPSSSEIAPGKRTKTVDPSLIVKKKGAKKNDPVPVLKTVVQEEKPEEEDFEIENDVVPVDFRVRDLAEGDYHVIKNLVINLADGIEFDSAELTSKVVEQIDVGAALSVGGDNSVEGEDTFGFISVMSLKEHKDLASIQFLVRHIAARTKHCPKFSKALHNALQKDTGLVLNERAVNTPYQVGAMLQVALRDDIKWMHDNEPNDPWHFTHYLVISKGFTVSSPDDTTANDKVGLPLGSFEFYKGEDKALLSAASAWTTYPVPNSAHSVLVEPENGEKPSKDSKDNEVIVSEHRIVALVSAKAWTDSLKQISEECQYGI